MIYNLYLFSHYSLYRRAELVWVLGQFLATRQEGDCRVVLYHLKKFFAEVWYPQKEDYIMLVRGVNDRNMLGPYLEAVDLEELMGEQ